MNHKPLIPLFSTKHLDELLVRVQPFRLWTLRFDFNIVYIPGKNLVKADALSRAPLMASDQHDISTSRKIFKLDFQAYMCTWTLLFKIFQQPNEDLKRSDMHKRMTHFAKE